MKPTFTRLLGFLLIFFGLFGATVGYASPAAQADEIIVLNIEGPVNQAMTAYFERGLQEAETRGARAILIELDTPGGSVTETLAIVQLFRNSPIPIIVYITPVGAQAASAGSVITLAAHANGMAPDTVIGAASPVNAAGEDISETLNRKIIEDLRAVMRTLTDERGAEATAVAEAMIEESRALTSQEALEVGLIDVVANSRTDLIQALDGKEISLNETPTTLDLTGAVLVSEPQTPVERFIYRLASILMEPLFITSLISLGVWAIIFEFSNPGGWVGGFIGFLCIGLALYGLGQLPTNWFGLALLGAGVILLVLEIFTPTFGALAATGTVTIVAGLILMFNTPLAPDFAQITWPAAISVAIVLGAVSILIVWFAVRSFQADAQSGREGMIGMVGKVRRPIVEDGDYYTGTVFVDGTLWTAEADEPIKQAARVEVVDVEGLTIKVQKATRV